MPYLRTLPLFREMTDTDILHILDCTHTREVYFDREQILWEISDQPFWGILAQGTLTLQQEDWHGNRSILGDFGAGEFLDSGALRAMAGTLPFFFSVTEKTTIIVMESQPALNPCDENCRAHLLFLRNVVEAMTEKETQLLYKIEYLSKRTTREKLMSYLNIQAARQGSRRIHVPYTRQELADLLGVDRSAMCTELTHMQNDGLIRYERKRFELLQERK